MQEYEEILAKVRYFFPSLHYGIISWNNKGTSLDTSASIGKRYSRNDELGTPLRITVDFDSVKDGSITPRDRDGTKQVRASQDKIIAAIKGLVEGQETWEEIFKRLPEFWARTRIDGV